MALNNVIFIYMNKNQKIKNTNAYHSYPDDGGKHPGLILIEEIWGVNDHIKSVADRLAAEGYSVLAPELLPENWVKFVTPELQQDFFNPKKRDQIQPEVREAMGPIYQPEFANKAIEVLKSCVDFLLSHESVNGKVGVIGFCFGGTYSFHLSAHDARIKAAVPFYGQPPSDEEIPNIQCPILAFYGDQDERLMITLPKLKEDMKKAGKDFEAVVYSGTGHAFFNDTNSRTYNAEYAKEAWSKATLFLKKNLG
jgi:carboxymethylenebutenolidase